MRGKALKAIEKRGALLVYPLSNKKEPLSIWSELYPRTKMRWEWDSSGDNRVASLWMLREELSRSQKVVYSKWFQGRATFFSRSTFVAMLAFLKSKEVLAEGLSPHSQKALDVLLSDSPLSTKQLKAALDMEGRLMEPTFNRALKPLWQHLLLVGYGEFADSSFPSLGHGATATLFEDLWEESHKLSSTKAEAQLETALGPKSPFLKFARRVRDSYKPR